MASKVPPTTFLKLVGGTPRVQTNTHINLVGGVRFLYDCQVPSVHNRLKDASSVLVLYIVSKDTPIDFHYRVATHQHARLLMIVTLEEAALCHCFCLRAYLTYMSCPFLVSINTLAFSKKFHQSFLIRCMHISAGRVAPGAFQ
jgi:hypothetical protein